MEMLCSLKYFYDKRRLNRILSNIFLFCIVSIYLLPPILAISGFYKLSDILLEFVFKTIGLDPVITAPIIIVFIVIYTFFILSNKILGTIYSAILFFNKFKRYDCKKVYEINNLLAFLSIVVPLFFLNFIGRFIFSFLI